MDKEEIAIRLDELKRLKKIDCFNEAYTTDVRPAQQVDIRIEELEWLSLPIDLETRYDTADK